MIINTSIQRPLFIVIVIVAALVLPLSLSLIFHSNNHPEAIVLNYSICCNLLTKLNCSASKPLKEASRGENRISVTSFRCNNDTLESIMVPNGSRITVAIYELPAPVPPTEGINYTMGSSSVYAVFANGSTVKLVERRAVFRTVGDACLIVKPEPGSLTRIIVERPGPGKEHKVYGLLLATYRLICPNLSLTMRPR